MRPTLANNCPVVKIYRSLRINHKLISLFPLWIQNSNSSFTFTSVIFLTCLREAFTPRERETRRDVRPNGHSSFAGHFAICSLAPASQWSVAFVARRPPWRRVESKEWRQKGGVVLAPRANINSEALLWRPSLATPVRIGCANDSAMTHRAGARASWHGKERLPRYHVPDQQRWRPWLCVCRASWVTQRTVRKKLLESCTTWPLTWPWAAQLRKDRQAGRAGLKSERPQITQTGLELVRTLEVWNWADLGGTNAESTWTAPRSRHHVTYTREVAAGRGTIWIEAEFSTRGRSPLRRWKKSSSKVRTALVRRNERKMLWYMSSSSRQGPRK